MKVINDKKNDSYFQLKDKTGKKLSKAKAESFRAGGYGHVNSSIVTDLPEKVKNSNNKIQVLEI